MSNVSEQAVQAAQKAWTKAYWTESLPGKSDWMRAALEAAVPHLQVQVDREALARWLYEHYDPRGNGTGQHWPWDRLSQQTKDQYGQQADAVLALLAPEEGP